MFDSIVEAQIELHNVRQHRLELSKQERQMELREAIIEEWLLTQMKPGDESVSEHCIISVYDKVKFGISDKAKLHGYVRDKDAFPLLITRINEKTAKEYREKKVKVPGMVAETIAQVSYRSV